MVHDMYRKEGETWSGLASKQEILTLKQEASTRIWGVFCFPPLPANTTPKFPFFSVMLFLPCNAFKHLIQLS